MGHFNKYASNDHVLFTNPHNPHITLEGRITRVLREDGEYKYHIMTEGEVWYQSVPQTFILKKI